MEELSALAKTLESKALAIKKETEEDRKRLEQEKASFHKEKELMSQRYKIDDLIIELNVGGRDFTSFKTTLCKIEDSMLAAMFSGRHPLTKDSRGRYFIDRDPVAFEVILNYLRTGYWYFPESKTEMSKLRGEMDYFGLKTLGHSLQYSFDMDTNGVFYFLGENGTKKWSNPTANGNVVVTYSSSVTGNANVILDRKMNQSIYSGNQPNSWFSFELRTATLQPSYYTLCTDASGYLTRSWDLEASNDGRTWKRLRSHLNDQCFTALSQARSWPITATEYFSQFRVRQTGPNSHSNNIFGIGDFELYGLLQEN